MQKKHIMDSIIDSNLIEENSVIVVGFSGGPDSLCLLHALASIADVYNLTLVPVHINHKLRPEADEEQIRAAKMCEKMGLDCNVFEVDCKAIAEELHISTEEAGRYIRYEIFDDVCEDLQAEGVEHDKIYVAVAHNADDQSETVLFRLLRGTGPTGLEGMPLTRATEKGFLLIRPLLGVTRKEIEQYIEVNKLHPNIDQSNEGTDYTRNKIRNELIPYLEKNYNPKIRQALLRYAELAQIDNVLLRDIAFSECSDKINIDSNMVRLDITGIKENPPAINSRIVNLIFDLIEIEDKISFELVNATLALIYSDNPSGSIDLPDGFRARREYETIIFSVPDKEQIIPIDSSLRMIPQVMMIQDYNPHDNSLYAAFDFDEFNIDYPGKVGELKLRGREEGDFIAIKNGHKKIQDYFVDSKVKKIARESILMVAIDNEVLWVLPSNYLGSETERQKGKYSQKYHVSDTTKRVLFIEIADKL